MGEHGGLAASSRRNSLTSMSTTNSVNRNAAAGTVGTVRSMSTDHLVTVDDKFVKKSVKKTGGVVPKGRTGDTSFHRSNAGAYYFPNGEVFRPRVSTTKRNRPGKINVMRDQAYSYPPGPRSAGDVPRTSSMVSMQSSATSATSATTAMSTMSANTKSNNKSGDQIRKSSSLSNLRMANKINLAHSLRSNRQDTPTNIQVQSLTRAPGAHSSQLAPSSAPANANVVPCNQSLRLQSTNVLKSNEALVMKNNNSSDGCVHESASFPPASTTTHYPPKSGITVSSDSNLSSLSNYNLNRSTSNTPQTSINTSIETEDCRYSPDTPSSHVGSDSGQKNTIVVTQEGSLGSKSSESIRDSELHSIQEIGAANKEDELSDESEYHSLDSQNANLCTSSDQAASQDRDIARGEQFIPDTVEKPTLQEVDNSSVSENCEDLDAEFEEHPSPNLSTLNEVTEDTIDSPVKLDLTAPLSSEELDAPQLVADNTSQEADNRPNDEEDDHSQSKSTESINSTKEQLAKASPGEEEENHPQLQSAESKTPNKEQLVELSPEGADHESLRSLPSPNFTVNGDQDAILTQEEEAGKELSPDNVGHSSHASSVISESGDSKSTDESDKLQSSKSNFFEFHKNDTFDKFLNDDQAEVPPRGDVSVVGDKIRKQERSVSSMSSFNSMLNTEDNSAKSPGKSPRKALPNSAEFPMSSKRVTKDIPEKDSPIFGMDKDSKGQFDTEHILHILDVYDSHKPAEHKLSETTGQSIDLSPEPATPENEPNELDAPEKSSVKASEYPVIKNTKELIQSLNSKTPISLNVDTNTLLKSKLSDIKKPKLKSLKTSEPNLSRSLSRANIKSFWKKMFTSNNIESPKSSKSDSSTSNSIRDSISSQSRSINYDALLTFSNQSKLKKIGINSRSFSLTNLRSVLSTNTSKSDTPDRGSTLYKIEEPELEVDAEPELEPSVDLTCTSDVFDDEEKLTLTKLPSIEKDTNMFGDMLTSFDKNMDNISHASNKVASKSINELFLRDDELTKDQIKDQQIMDSQQQDDFSDNNDIDPKLSFESLNQDNTSDDFYIDDNIRYLQAELFFPDEGMEEHLTISGIHEETTETPAGRPLSGVKTASKDDNVEVVIVHNSQLMALPETEKYKLPMHLRHVGQFTDYQTLEVSVRKFEPHLIHPVAPGFNEGDNLASIVKHNKKSDRKSVQFSNKICINETFSPDSYKRYNKSVTQYTLTESAEINRIKTELNIYKCNEMLVHEMSQNNTHFFY